MKNFTKQFTLLATLLAALTILPAAQAATVSGEINFAGTFQPTGGTGLGDATGIDFNGNGLVDSSVFVVTGATDDFGTYASFGTLGTISDFTFDPFVSVDPLWSVGGFSFSLATLTIIEQSDVFISMTGGGTITGNGYEATLGSWSLSGEAGNLTFGWSATAVSEPATLALMGLGLVGLGAMARRKKAA